MEPTFHQQASAHRPHQPGGGFHSPFEGSAPREPRAAQYPDPASPPNAASPFEIAPGPDPVGSDRNRHQTAEVGFGATQPTAPQQAAPAPLEQAPVSDLPPGAYDDPREFVEMNVLQLLGTVAPEQLGIPAMAISPFAKTRIPMGMLKSQLSSGQVFLNLSDVIVGCSHEHRAGMAGCKPDLRIKVPIALIFPNVRTASAPAPLPNPFGKAGTDPIAENPVDRDRDGSQPESPAREEFDLSGDFGSPLSALAPLGGARQHPEEPEPSADRSEDQSSPLPPLMPAGSHFGHFGDFGCADPEPPAAVSIPADAGPAEAAPAEAASAQDESDQDESDEEDSICGGGWPFDGLENHLPPVIEDFIESLEDLPPLSEVGEPMMPPGFANIGNLPTDRQAALRGLFLHEGKIDADTVAQHCAELPGIECCVVLGTAGALGSGCAESESEDFSRDAARLHACLLDLLAAAGVEDSERFTIRTDRKMVSFFRGGELAIAVRHGEEGFLPGVHERLAIIARELGNLEPQPF